MKWFIRVLCFILTTLIYIPIESALHAVGTGSFMVGIITIAVYVFIFLIPSNALVAMWEKRKTNTAPATASQSNAVPETAGHSNGSDESAANREALYFITTKDGDTLRIPESKMNNYYAAHTSEDTVKRARLLSSFLMRTAMQFAKESGFPLNFHCFTFFWCSLYLSIQDIAKANRIDDMMTHQYRLMLSKLIKDKPSKVNLSSSLIEFQLTTMQLLAKEDIDQQSYSGIADLLEIASSVMLQNSDDPNQRTLATDSIALSEYAFAVTEVHDYAIKLFSPNSSFYMESANGMLVRVPEDKLDSWQAAQDRIRNGTSDVVLTEKEKLLRDMILEDIYGPDSENK